MKAEDEVMASQNDDSSRRTTDQRGKRSTAAAEPATAAPEPSRTASEELTNAYRDYYRSVYQAWLHAAEESGKANSEFAAAQQRIMLETGFQRTAAYFTWLRAVQVASAETSGKALREAYQAYSAALEETARAGRSQWDQSQQSRRRAFTAVSDAYIN